MIFSTGGLLSKMMSEASSKKGSIPMSSVVSSYTETADPKPIEKALYSVFEKEAVTKQKFEMGAMNFRIIQMKGSPEETLKEITEWYKENYPEITQPELNALINKAFFDEMSLIEETKNSTFSPFGDYISLRERSNKTGGATRKKVYRKGVKKFLDDLNDLYKSPKRKQRWDKMFYMVNGTPDTAYYIPIQTDVLFNKLDGIPLGFSYDSVVRAFRVVYIPTGDPMFSYVYDNPLDAIKARSVHMKMLNWALEPQEIAQMYREWYGTPKRYNDLFQLLHKEMFGELPPFYLKVEGIFDAEKYFPDWRDQRAHRNTLLSGVGGMGGIKDNSQWSEEAYEKRLKGQDENYMSLKEEYKRKYKIIGERGRERSRFYPGMDETKGVSPFHIANVNQSKKSKGKFAKPSWLKKLQKKLNT